VNIIQEGMVVDFKVSLLFQNKWGGGGWSDQQNTQVLAQLVWQKSKPECAKWQTFYASTLT